MGIYGPVYGPVYGSLPAQGTASGTFKWAGSASGIATVLPAGGTAAGSFTWRGSAVGSAVSLDAARYIQSQARSVTYLCTISGVEYPVKSFNTDAQLRDIPTAVSQIGGVAAGQVQFTLAHIVARQLSPFQGVAPSPVKLSGAPVTLSVSFWTGQPGVGVPVYTARIFTGYLQTYRMDAVSDLQVTALDPSYLCAGQFNLPMAAVDPTTRAASTDPGYSSLAPTEAALRASGIYLTAPPSSTDAKLRGRYLVMAVSGYGGNMPEVGQLLTTGTVLARGPGKFGPDVWRAQGCAFRGQNVSRRVFGRVWMDGWVTVNPGTVTNPVVRAFNRTGLGYPAVTLQVVAGKAQFVVSGFGGVHYAASPVSVADGLPRYWRGSYQVNAAVTSITITVQVGSTITTVTEACTVADLQLWDDAGNGDDTVVYPSSVAAVEAFELWAVPVGYLDTPGQDRSTWGPGTASVVAPSPVRLDLILGRDDLNCWDSIQQIAAAEGALAWFDGAGVFHRDTLQVFNRRKLSPPTFTYGADRIDNLPVSVSSDGVRRSVSVQVQRWSVAQSTPAVPVWSADNTLTAAARTTTVLQVEADVRGVNLWPLVSAVGPASGAGDSQSHYQAVDASTVGDPSAALVRNLTVTVAPTNTGFSFTVVNPNPFAVAFWSPTLGGPYLELQGARISQGAVQTITADGNPTAPDDLQLDLNEWRIDFAAARKLVRSIASGTYNAIPELSNITVPGDPRRFLGELVAVQAPSIMPLPERCLVVSMSFAGDTGNRFTMSLGLRPIGPPAGWLAGVPGRSEAGVTTYAPIR